MTLTKRPVFDVTAEWDFVHHFAGAFHGWGQAVNVLRKLVENFRIGAQVSVDFDSEVAQVWIERHKLPRNVGPLFPKRAFEAHSQAFVQTNVLDHAVFHLIPPQANLRFTALPPCQPWSRGGRAAGIACPNGWAFVDAIRITIAGQPHMLTLECVDEVSSHGHFALLCETLDRGGYGRAWHHAAPSHVNRPRWLGVWLRRDIFVETEGVSLPIRAERIIT